jgi:DNA adenine methylase
VTAPGPPATPGPFLRWVGGKRRLLSELERRLPERFGRYHEPFLGGGALFFALWRAGRVGAGAGPAPALGDVNPDLIHAYRRVRDRPDAVATWLRTHHLLHSADHFAAVRALERDRPPDAADDSDARAARFVYLANAGFNGGWRVDRQGAVASAPTTAPFPEVVDADNVRAASRALRSAELRSVDFRVALADVQALDLVYLDPPFVPPGHPHETQGYTAAPFSFSDQEEVWRRFVELDRRGALVVLSAPWRSHFRATLGGFRVARVGQIGRAAEALVTNW